MSITVANMSNFGDSRTRDVFHRNAYQVAAASDKGTAVSADHTFFGITAANSVNAIGATTQFELVKMQAVESAADGLAGRLDITINDGTNATAGVKVAELSAVNAKFVAATLSADFGSNYGMNVTSGGSAVTQTFKTSATAANDVQLKITSDNLEILAAAEIKSSTAKVTSNFGSNHAVSTTGTGGAVTQTISTSATSAENVTFAATANNLNVSAAAEIKSTTAKVTSDFGSDYTMNVTSGGSAVTQTFTTSATAANDVAFKATSDNLQILAAAEIKASTAKVTSDFGANHAVSTVGAAGAVTQTISTSATSAENVTFAATANNLNVSAAAQIKSTTAQTVTDFGASHTLSTVGTAGAVTQTYTTASGGVGDVLVTATADNLKLTASNVDTTGEITVQGNRANWYQAGTTEGTLAARKSAANVEYNYVHNAGTTGTSTGYMNFNLDAQNASLNAMGAGGYTFKSYNAAGTTETLLAMGAGATAGEQTIQFSNSYLGVNTTPSTAYRLDVSGDSRVSGNMTVTGDLIVSGTTTTIDTQTVQVEDSNISMAYNVSDPTLFDQGGITVGTGASAATFNYNNTLVAWDANIGINIPTAKDFTIAGGVDTTADTGVTINESGISFGSDDAQIAFGTAAVITKDGLAAQSDDFAVTFGAQKQWKLLIENVGGVDYFSMQFSGDSGASYNTKFSVAP